MDKYIPLSVPNLKGNELKYVTKAIEDEWVSTGGSYIYDFEKNIAQYVGTKNAVACQSGTAGIHLALMAESIGKDDEVLVPALTFIAAVNPIKYVGAEPVFMDCDSTLCMDMDKVELFCMKECKFNNGQLVNKTTGRTIKAMILVHIFGNIANIEKAMEIKEKFNLIIIEDATEALGSYIKEGIYKDKFAGTIGDVGIYSFNGNKIITTGGGGMIVSDNLELLSRTKYLSTQAKDDRLFFSHNEIGYNYRMTNLQAALGLAQLEQLESFIITKKNNYNMYIECGIELLPFREDIRPNYWFYSYMTDRRDALIDYLDKNKVQSRPIWNLICDLKPYQHSNAYKIKSAYKYWEYIVNIPCSSNLIAEDVEHISNLIRTFV